MQMNYYENLLIELPDGIQEMTEDEKRYFYPQMSLDFAWIDKNSSNIYCIKRQLEVSLEKKNVKSRIAAYDEYYKRMCPGYQRGEILMRREKLFNLGILSYKTNTPKSMRFYLY